MMVRLGFFFFQAEDGIRDLVRSRGLGDVYKRQVLVGHLGEGVLDPPSVDLVRADGASLVVRDEKRRGRHLDAVEAPHGLEAVSYTHLTLPTSDLV